MAWYFSALCCAPNTSAHPILPELPVSMFQLCSWPIFLGLKIDSYHWINLAMGSTPLLHLIMVSVVPQCAKQQCPHIYANTELENSIVIWSPPPVRQLGTYGTKWLEQANQTSSVCRLWITWLHWLDSPAILEILISLPLDFRSSGKNAFDTSIAPKKFTSMHCLYVFMGSNSASALNPKIPALLTMPQSSGWRRKSRVHIVLVKFSLQVLKPILYKYWASSNTSCLFAFLPHLLFTPQLEFHNAKTFKRCRVSSICLGSISFHESGLNPQIKGQR